MEPPLKCRIIGEPHECYQHSAALTKPTLSRSADMAISQPTSTKSYRKKMGGSLWARLFSKTRVNSSGCIEWTGSITEGGYGHLWVNDRLELAHRLAFALVSGPIPEGGDVRGMCVCHRCDNRLCVNPDHLFLGTHAENMRDMDGKGRRAPTNGQRNGRAKLTAEQVKEIRSLKGAMSQAAIGARFGVSKTLVRRIHQGKAWREFPASSNP